MSRESWPMTHDSRVEEIDSFLVGACSTHPTPLSPISYHPISRQDPASPTPSTLLLPPYRPFTSPPTRPHHFTPDEHAEAILAAEASASPHPIGSSSGEVVLSGVAEGMTSGSSPAPQSGKTCGCFALDGCLRRVCLSLVASLWFDRCMLVVILIWSASITFYSPRLDPTSVLAIQIEVHPSLRGIASCVKSSSNMYITDDICLAVICTLQVIYV